MENRQNVPQALKASPGELVSAIKVEDIIQQVVKLPIVKVNRANFLRKELIRYYPKDVVDSAIKNNPAYAGVAKDRIKRISKQVINYETNKVAAISFVAGLPGGIAMAATIPADIAQYFGFMLRAMQKLAYLYGFDEFQFNEDEINDETMNTLLLFLGVMFGVQGANAGVKKLAFLAAQRVAKVLEQKALTKGVVYPIIKKIAQAVGVRMTKQIFAAGVGKAIPIVGGVFAGGLSYATFKPCAKKLRDSFQELPLCDPAFYEDDRAIDIDFMD